MDSLGDRLRWLRTSAGMTTRQVDELAELAPGHSTQLENGIIRAPTIRTMSRIARIFGVEPSWIADGVGPAPAKDEIIAAARRMDRPSP